MARPPPPTRSTPMASSIKGGAHAIAYPLPPHGPREWGEMDGAACPGRRGEPEGGGD